MYKTDYGIVYETLDELLTQNIAVIYEYGGFLYVKLKPTEEYDDSMWKVNVKTGKASYVDYTACFEIINKAKEINPLTLKRAS